MTLDRDDGQGNMIGSDTGVNRVVENEMVRSELARSLSEASIIAHDAKRAAKSMYEDRVLMAITFALLGAVVGPVILMVWTDYLDGFFSLWPFNMMALILIGVVIGLGIWLPSRDLMTRAMRYDDWSRKLQEASLRELRREPSQNESAIELLLEVIDRLPEWLRVKRKSYLDMNAWIWIVSLVLMLGGLNHLGQYVPPAIDDLSSFDLFNILAGALSLGLGLAVLLIWNWDVKRKDRLYLARWQSYMDGLLQRFEGL